MQKINGHLISERRTNWDLFSDRATERVWHIVLDGDPHGDYFATYPTKGKAVADARRYNIHLTNK